MKKRQPRKELKSIIEFLFDGVFATTVVHYAFVFVSINFQSHYAILTHSPVHYHGVLTLNLHSLGISHIKLLVFQHPKGS